MKGKDDIMLHGRSDQAVLASLGDRLRRRRLELNWSQGRLAEAAGLNRTTISELERGKPTSLATFVQVLRALGALHELDGLLPDSGPSPIQLAKSRGQIRQRASKQRRPNSQEEST